MILVDSNIFMYAVGRDHPLKAPSIAWLERAARGDFEARVDAEVLQEIIHRYRSIDRWSAGRRVFDLARRAIPGTLPVTEHVVDRARSLMDRYDDLSARDALHSAVVLIHGLEGICSYDLDFDRVEGIRRLEPEAV